MAGYSYSQTVAQGPVDSGTDFGGVGSVVFGNAPNSTPWAGASSIMGDGLPWFMKPFVWIIGGVVLFFALILISRK